MNFLVGLGLTIPLMFFTMILWLVSQKLPGEMVLAIIGIMIFGDAILAGVWYFGIGEEMLDMKRFRLGMGFAFCATSFGRALYFLIKGNLTFD
tara:strand:+ start:392 stop:670 length:279 start_codon:yes stop_codon:yes gene_type:complete